MTEREQAARRASETAPKSGASVLVRDYYTTDWQNHPDGRYAQTGPDGFGVVVARFTEAEGWHVSASVVGGIYIKLRNPAHWMPLPTPPATMETSPSGEG